MRFAYWIPKATNMLRICITYCFSIARIVHGHSSMLSYMYIVCFELGSFLPLLMICLSLKEITKY